MATIANNGIIIIKSQGPQGVPGEGVPVGGTTGQFLVKDSNDDYDTTWISITTTLVPEGSNLYFTDERAQDAIGAMIDATLRYVDATPLLGRAAITGDITIPVASNASTLATVNSNVGTYGDGLHVAQFTVNAKGLITAVAAVAIAALTVTQFASPNVSQWTNDAGYLTAADVTGFVPYTGATSNLNLGAHSITASNFSGSSSGTNTGDQTNITGNAGTATALQNARTIGGVSFNGTADIVPQTIQSINEASDTTCFPLFINASGSQSLQPKNNTALTFNASTGAFGATSFTGIGSSLNITALGTSTAINLAARFGMMVSVKDFGAVGDGSTDDTAFIQAGIDYVQLNNMTLFFPAGNYKITAKLNVSQLPGWGFQGSGMSQTNIFQYTDNTPIFDMGATAGTSFTKYFVDGFSFDWHNIQTGNTNAVVFLFNVEAYQGRITNIEFTGGYWGVYVTAGIFRPWGTTWDNLLWNRNCVGGAINTALGTGATPNNQYGRLAVDATNMTQDIFALHGYDSTIATIEVFTSPNSIRVLNIASTGIFDIGTIKLETYTFSGAGVVGAILDVATGSLINVGTIWIGNTSTVNVTSGFLSLVNSQYGGTDFTRIKIGNFRANAITNFVTGTAVLFSGGGTSTNGIVVGSVDMGANWTLQNNAGNTVANVLKVNDYLNGYLSANVGDSDLTLVSGDPTTQQFKTTFTAPRTINLPNIANNLCGGMFYTFVFSGAINGSNTAVIKAGSVTYATLTADCVVTLQWRRSTGTAANDWVVVENSSTTTSSASVITNDTTTNATMYPVWVTANAGNLPLKVSSTKMSFNPSTGVFSSTSFTGAGTGLTGTAASLTAGTVTTNANLTGPITSSGNTTSVAAQTGTGSTFVMQSSPVLTTPNIGTPTAGVLSACTGLPISTGVSGLGTGVATFLITPSSANLAAAVTDETGTGALVFATSPTLVTPNIGVATGSTLTLTGAALTEANVAANTSTAYTIDQANGSGFQLTLNTATPTLTLQTAPTSAKEVILYVQLIQDGTGGRQPTWANVTWATGSAPAIAQAAAALTTLTFVAVGGVWYGYAAYTNVGVSDASNAVTGYVGEVVTSTRAVASALSVSNASDTTVTSITLTAGDWEVWGNIGFIAAAGTIPTQLAASVSANNNSQATPPNGGASAQIACTFGTASTNILLTGTTRINISVTTIYYLVGTAAFTVSTMTAYGAITARRMR